MEQKYNRTGRQSNLELLRLLAMLLIVAHHFVVHGGFMLSALPFGKRFLWLQLLYSGGKIGVNLFVLISGYFLVTVQKINLEKVVRLYLQTWICSISLTLIFSLFGQIPETFQEFLAVIFPIGFHTWWFMSTYLLFYLIVPYLNHFLRSLSQVQHRKILLFLGLFWIVFPSFIMQSYQLNDLLWFVYLYFVTAYIRFYPENIQVYKKHFRPALVGVVIVSYLLLAFFSWQGTNSLISDVAFLFGQNRMSAFAISLLLFLVFLDFSIPQNRLINALSATTLGIYLLHDHPLMREFIWKTLFQNARFYYSRFFLPYSIVVIGLVFVSCAVLAMVLQILLKRCEPLVPKLAAWLQTSFETLYSKFPF